MKYWEIIATRLAPRQGGDRKLIAFGSGYRVDCSYA